MSYPTTPDGRYFVHRGRLWRCTNPYLDESLHQRLVNELMHACRDVRDVERSGDIEGMKQARALAKAAKVALGERGPTWWDDDVDLDNNAVHRRTASGVSKRTTQPPSLT